MNKQTIQIKITGKYTPEYKTEGSSGLDLCSMENVTLHQNEAKIIKTGVHVSMPMGMEAQVRGRSGLASKGIFAHFGTVDSDYRGDIGVILYNINSKPFEILQGDRIAQLIFMPIIKANLEICEELDQTERGTGGFGSTGR